MMLFFLIQLNQLLGVQYLVTMMCDVWCFEIYESIDSDTDPYSVDLHGPVIAFEVRSLILGPALVESQLLD